MNAKPPARILPGPADRTVAIVVFAAAAVGLALASQRTWYGDEGMDLLAATLVTAGKTPYRDFFYQHLPLYAYVASAWMRLAGESWRAAHVLSALLTAATAALIVQFCLTRVRNRKWRVTTALAAALLFTLNTLVLDFGTIGQGYAFSVLLCVGAFYSATQRDAGPRHAFWTGLLAAAAVFSSLLVLPLWPILFAWTLKHSARESRRRYGTWFLSGSIVPLLALAWFAVRAPRQLTFDVVEYHLRYRWAAESAAGIVANDLREIWATWIDSAQGMLLMTIGLVGVLFVSDRGEWEPRDRAELNLCATLAGALLVYLAITRPTFHQYFVLVIPFFSIVAALGIQAIGARIWTSGRPAVLAALLLALYALPTAKWLRARRPLQSSAWVTIEAAAREVNRLTAKTDPIYTENSGIYFAARRLPPPRLENPFGSDVSSRLAPALADTIRTVDRTQIADWLKSGRFAAALFERGDPRISELFPTVYREQRMFECNCTPIVLLWNRAIAPAVRPPAQ